MEGLHWVTLFSGHFVSTNFDPKWTPNPPFPVLSAAFAKLSPCDSMILAKRIIQRAKLLAVFEKSLPCPGFVDLLFETLRSLALALSEKTSWKFGSIRHCCPKSPGPQQTLDHPRAMSWSKNSIQARSTEPGAELSKWWVHKDKNMRQEDTSRPSTVGRQSGPDWT